jgi:HD superfamily phosphohydrolase
MEKERKHQDLHEQLTLWFTSQNKWDKRRAFAEDIGIPYTQIEHYFRGDAFPRGEGRKRLYEETHISCLAPEQPDFFENKSPDNPPAQQQIQASTALPQQAPAKGNDLRLDEEPDKTIRIAVSGDVTLRRLETAIIDTREFQRLRSLKQLCSSYLVYPSAVHTRFEHSLGTLYEASRMIEYVRNNPKSEMSQKKIDNWDEVLARLAALLHDVPQVPFGHTLEDEACLIMKHDEDTERRRILIEESQIGKTIIKSIGREKLDLLLKIIGIKHKDVEKLKEHAYISDIVNNTLCADLLDYLKRDVYFCNLHESYSDRFLRYLYLDEVDVDEAKRKDPEFPKRARRLIVRLWKQKIGRERRDVLSELTSLLRIRYSLGEKVYFHHAKNSSSAMLSRAVWAAMHPENGAALKISDLYLIGDDQLLSRLADSKDPVAKRLANALLKRALYKRVYTLTRTEANAVPSLDCAQHMIDDFHKDPANRTEVENQLASLCNLDPGDVLIYCPQLNMASKYASMLVEWREKHIPLNTIDDLATKQALEAILSAHDLLWGVQVFVISSAMENQRIEQDLRRCCQWKFAPVNTKDRESRLSDAIRAIINEKVSSSGSTHSGSAQKVEQAVERVLARARNSSTSKITMVDIDQAIKETLD